MLFLHSDSPLPLYEQLYQALKQQILTGEMTANTRLPATRTLADTYHISRNTVIAAYEQLAAEGYIHSRIGSGYYVETLPRELFPTSHPVPERSNQVAGVLPAESESQRFPFQYGSLNLNPYKTRAFRKCLQEALTELEQWELLPYPDPQGNHKLRAALTDSLALTRGVRTEPGQVYITGGIQYALRALTDLFPSNYYTFAIEDPGYSGALDVFRNAGYRLKPIPLDNNGLDTQYLQDLGHTLLYVTPSHQFPMGSILPIRRRLELLQWAEKTNSYIIEDDYDSELRYGERPIPSLQSLARKRVIYLGTFSKALSPELRAAYMVLPPGLKITYGDTYKYFGTSVPQWEQLALEKYIRSGEYAKRLNFMRTTLKKRHDFIVHAFRETFPTQVKLYGTGGGIHLVVEIRTRLARQAIFREFAARGVSVMSLQTFWSTPALCPENQVLIGYGAISYSRLPDYMNAMTEAIKRMI